MEIFSRRKRQAFVASKLELGFFFFPILFSSPSNQFSLSCESPKELPRFAVFNFSFFYPCSHLPSRVSCKSGVTFFAPSFPLALRNGFTKSDITEVRVFPVSLWRSVFFPLPFMMVVVYACCGLGISELVILPIYLCNPIQISIIPTPHRVPVLLSISF